MIRGISRPLSSRSLREAFLAVGLSIGAGLAAVRAAELRDPTSLILAIALLALFAAAWWWTGQPGMAVTVAFVALVPLPVSKTVGGLAVTVADVAAAGLIMLLLLGLIQKPKRTRRVLPLIAATILLLLAGLLSIFAARFPDVAFGEFAKWSLAVCLSMLLALTVRCERDIWKAVLILVVVSDFVAVYAVLEWISHGQVNLVGKYFGFGPLDPVDLRVASTFGYANTLAGYFAIVAPFALAVLIRSQFHIAARALGMVSLLLVGVATTLTFSRGGILAELGGLLVAAFLLGGDRPRLRYAAAAAGAITAVWVIASVLGVDQRVLERLFVQSQIDIGDPNGRISYWANILTVLHGHELSGVGLGNFVLLNPYPLPGLSIQNTHAQSTYFQILLETGLVGGVAGILFLVSSLRTGYIMSRMRSAPGLGLIGVALTASMAAAAIDGVFDWLYFSSQMVNLLTLIGGMLAAGVMLPRSAGAILVQVRE